MHKITREWTFEAAHHLIGVPPGHKCGKVHGHSYRVIAEIEGEVGAIGWIIDYADMDRSWEEIRKSLDHSNLNIVMSANPTAENLARWIFERLHLPGLVRVTVSETSRSSASYSPKPSGALITTKEAAAMLGIHHLTLKKWRAAGSGPPFIRLPNAEDDERRSRRGRSGERQEDAGRVRYRPQDINDWIAGLHGRAARGDRA